MTRNLSIAVLATLVLGACSDPTPAPSPTPSRTPAITTTATASPAPSPAATATPKSAPAASATATATATRTAPTAAPSSVYYANCDAARAAGAAPLYRGQPGYRSALDRDNDGVACE